jgi:hypothetical protein
MGDGARSDAGSAGPLAISDLSCTYDDDAEAAAAAAGAAGSLSSLAGLPAVVAYPSVFLGSAMRLCTSAWVIVPSARARALSLPNSFVAPANFGAVVECVPRDEDIPPGRLCSTGPPSQIKSNPPTLRIHHEVCPTRARACV